VVKIVVLDGHALNPGDLSWEALQELGSTEIYDRTENWLIIERAAEAEIVLTNKTPLTADVLRQLPGLRYIGVLATGYDCVDTKTAKELHILVTNIPTYGTPSVAQFTIALLLELCHNVKLHSDAVRNGEWSRSKDWCFWLTPLLELESKVIGIVGLGRIGEQVGRIASAFGMQVRATTRRKANNSTRRDIKLTSLEALLAESDVVSLHCPLLPETQGLINAKRIRLMKPSAFLINTSRGGLVLEQDLAEALNADRIAGAGLDVLSVEPPLENNPLFKAKNCLITPHIAWATREARQRLMAVAVANVASFLKNEPQNVVSA
jgi:glycerate dehydrogenase